MKHHLIIPLAAGLLTGCGKEAAPSSAPVPVVEPAALPPAPAPEKPAGPPPWNDIDDRRADRTNPPTPRLVVEPDGTCHKYMQASRKPMQLVHIDTVHQPSGPAYVGKKCGPSGTTDLELEYCGEVRQCPAFAEKVLADWKKAQQDE